MKSDKKALLILDMSKVYIFGKEPLIPVAKREQLINNIKTALNIARKNKLSVIYINSAFRKTDPIFKLINYRDQGMEEKPGDIDVIRELKPIPGELLLFKRGFDGFWESNLDKTLRKNGINSLYLTGCQTDCCIRETAVTAAHLGYKVFTLEDCCQTKREFGQITALRFLSICSKIISLKEFSQLSH